MRVFTAGDAVLDYYRMDTQHYRTLLQSELDLVATELRTLGIQNPDNPQDWVATPRDTDEGEADENVAADRAEELEEREAILADLENRFNATRAALARIDAGTYGMCEVCTASIEADRLTANPAARTCTEHREALV